MNLLVEWVKFEEGFRPQPYRDTQGVWTVGYGRSLEAHPIPRRDFAAHPYTNDEAEDWLRERLRDLYFELRQIKPIIEEIDPPRAAALLNMAYQLGISGLLRFRRLWASVEERNWTQAALMAGDSLWAIQTPNRARRVCYALASGEWPSEVNHA